MRWSGAAPNLGRWLAAALLVFVSVTGASHHHSSPAGRGSHGPSTDPPCGVCAAVRAPAYLVVAAAVVAPHREVTLPGETAFPSPMLDRIGELPDRSPPQAS